MKMIGKSWIVNRNELIMTIIAMLVAWVCGIILVGVIVHLDDGESYAIMGVYVTIIILIAGYLFASAISFERRFSAAVGMGRTRREFFVCHFIVMMINTALEMLALAGMYLMEKTLCRVLYPGMSCGFDIMPYVVKPGWIVAMLLLVPSAGMLLGMLITRFQRKAFWALWVFWMAGSLSISKIGHMIEENPDTVPVRLINRCVEIFQSLGVYGQAVFLLLLCIILLSGAFAGLRKQEVRQI